MGGDRGPGEIVAGARPGRHRARDRRRARRTSRGDHPASPRPHPARRRGARRPRRHHHGRRAGQRGAQAQGLLDRALRPRRCATATADAMVSAGNTGAVTTAAVLRMRAVPRRPDPGHRGPHPRPRPPPPAPRRRRRRRRRPPRTAVQYAHGRRVRAAPATGSRRPAWGCSPTARRPARATRSANEPTSCCRDEPGFVGNVEGRDFMHPDRADVIVTDGFTGNVALKSLEGALRALAGVVFRVLDATPEAREAAAVLLPMLLAAAGSTTPTSPAARCSRRRRGLHHLPRLVVGPGDRQRRRRRRRLRRRRRRRPHAAGA